MTVALLLYANVLPGWAMAATAFAAGAIATWRAGRAISDHRGAETERAKRVVEQQHTRLIDAIETVPEGIAIWDAEDRFVLCNSGYRAIYDLDVDMVRPGVTFESMVRATVARGRHPIITGDVEAWIAERLAQHRRTEVAHDQQLANGRWIRVEDRRTSDGGIVGVRVDITDLKRREAEVRLLFEANPAPMLIHDFETGALLDVNHSAIAQYGYDLERFLSLSMKELQCSDAPPPRSGTAAARHRKADGAEILVETHSHAIDYRGCHAILTVATDVTERHRAEIALRTSEAQLRRSEERLAHAQRIAAMGSWEMDLVSGELTWSREMYRIWQPLPETYSPMRDGVVRHICDGDRQKVADWLAQLKAGGAAPAIEFRVPGREGGTRILRSEGVPVRNATGAVIQVAGTLQDVTQTRQLEQERNELYMQLLHSQKLEALGTLAGGVAHDLNNTLVPVISLSKIVMSKFPPGSREHASVELILEAGQRARDLVRQVLAFSRKTDAERLPLTLGTFVADVLRIVQPSLPAGIVVEQQLTAVPPVTADPNQLHQVLVVLLTNAAQAIGDNPGTVTVEVAGDDGRLAAMRRSSASVPGVRLTVRDTGCGMDAVTKRRIFEPFFTTKEVGRGTGLGLSVVHGIVSGHGGLIDVESEPGVGTRFDIYLPCEPQSAAEAIMGAIGVAAS